MKILNSFKKTFLTFIFFWGMQSIFAQETNPRLKQSLPLTQLLELSKKIIFKPNYLQKTFSLSYQKNKVAFELDKPYLVNNSYFIPLKDSAFWYNKQVYLPFEMAEEILSELSLPIKYNIKNNQLNIKPLAKNERFEKNKKLKFIVIDPGHGGKDTGAIGFSGTHEKDIVLEAGTLLFYHLKKEFPELSIYITRLDDTYLTLTKRSEIANRKKNENGYGIFISLHCNAVFSFLVNGYEIYYLAQNSHNEAIRQLSLKENNYTDAPDIYSEILQTFLINAQIQKESKVLATEIDRTFMSIMDGDVSRRGIRKADFSVLRLTLMPAILVEMGYITNEKEEMVLKSKSFYKKLNQAITLGIRNYIKKTN